MLCLTILLDHILFCLESPDFVLEFFNFVEVCFYHRRKKLINSLNLGGQFYKKNEQKIVSILEEMGFNKDTRPEELSLENYIFLFINNQF